MWKNKSGFTIIELIVVIVVIAILATITFVSYNGVQAKARDDRRLTDVSNIEKAMELYYSDNGSYPVPTGATGSAINGGWYSSGDSSWNMLSGLLVGSDAIDTVPVDPINTNASILTSLARYNYAVFVSGGGYCGAAKGQMYLIVFRLENKPKQKISDGACTITPVLGDSYYDNYGVSYYRNVKGV